MQKFKNTSSLAIGLSLAVLMAACSIPTPSLPSVSPTYPNPKAKLTPAEVTDQFVKIADASCRKALEVGVVEQSVDPEGFTLVMVPKAQAYKDFSAAYFQPEEIYELIWETDAFSACGASMSFALAIEGGAESDIKVSYNTAEGKFETTQDLGEYGVTRLSYTIAKNLFSGIQSLGNNTADARTIRYGHLTDADWNILRTAVDAFLADQ